MVDRDGSSIFWTLLRDPLSLSGLDICREEGEGRGTLDPTWTATGPNHNVVLSRPGGTLDGFLSAGVVSITYPAANKTAMSPVEDGLRIDPTSMLARTWQPARPNQPPPQTPSCCRASALPASLPTLSNRTWHCASHLPSPSSGHGNVAARSEQWASPATVAPPPDGLPIAPSTPRNTPPAIIVCGLGCSRPAASPPSLFRARSRSLHGFPSCTLHSTLVCSVPCYLRSPN